MNDRTLSVADGRPGRLPASIFDAGVRLLAGQSLQDGTSWLD